jgi:hypothetical protein
MYSTYFYTLSKKRNLFFTLSATLSLKACAYGSSVQDAVTMHVATPRMTGM